MTYVDDYDSEPEPVTCPSCEGQRGWRIPTALEPDSDSPPDWQPCEDCRGSGEVPW